MWGGPAAAQQQQKSLQQQRLFRFTESMKSSLMKGLFFATCHAPHSRPRYRRPVHGKQLRPERLLSQIEPLHVNHSRLLR